MTRRRRAEIVSDSLGNREEPEELREFLVDRTSIQVPRGVHKDAPPDALVLKVGRCRVQELLQPVEWILLGIVSLGWITDTPPWDAEAEVQRSHSDQARWAP